jgi:hypothetical protein
MYRGKDPEGQLTKMYFCGISKMFLLHVCLVCVHVPKFYWHKTSLVKVLVYLVSYEDDEVCEITLGVGILDPINRNLQ